MFHHQKMTFEFRASSKGQHKTSSSAELTDGDLCESCGEAREMCMWCHHCSGV
jgi:hypothetical protein